MLNIIHSMWCWLHKKKLDHERIFLKRELLCCLAKNIDYIESKYQESLKKWTDFNIVSCRFCYILRASIVYDQFQCNLSENIELHVRSFILYMYHTKWNRFSFVHDISFRTGTISLKLNTFIKKKQVKKIEIIWPLKITMRKNI